MIIFCIFLFNFNVFLWNIMVFFYDFRLTFLIFWSVLERLFGIGNFKWSVCWPESARNHRYFDCKLLGMLNTNYFYTLPNLYLPNWDFGANLGSEISKLGSKISDPTFESFLAYYRSVKILKYFEHFFWIVAIFPQKLLKIAQNYGIVTQKLPKLKICLRFSIFLYFWGIFH